MFSMLQCVHHDDARHDAEGATVKAITVRNLPSDLDKTIRQRARGKRMSVNKVVIGLLEERLTQVKTKRTDLYHDLDDLCESWTEDTAAAFDQALAKQRAIDPDVWK
jgi:plasmid stability protein